MPCAVIVTALSVEYLAVRAHLSNFQEEVHPQGTIYGRGRFAANEQTWEVGIIEVGSGSVGAAGEIEQAIAYFNPQVVLSIEIAGIENVVPIDAITLIEEYSCKSSETKLCFQHLALLKGFL